MKPGARLSFPRRREPKASIFRWPAPRTRWIPASAGMTSHVSRGLRAVFSRGLRAVCLHCLVAFAALLVGAAAHAEVWGHVDAQGVAHFASEKLDERYVLFYRGGDSFDTSEGVPDRTPRAVAVPTSSTSRLLAFFDVSPSYKQVKHHLREASRRHGIDYELLQALIATESGFDAAAVSPKGAVGLMQVMPATAQRYGVQADRKASVDQKLADPATNIRAGSRYLRYLLDLYPGNMELALAAYNAGEGAVLRAGNQIPNYRETQNYVKTVLQLYAMLKPPAMAAPRRVQVEFPGAPPGGALGRGNLPADPPRAPLPADPLPAFAAGMPATD